MKKSVKRVSFVFFSNSANNIKCFMMGCVYSNGRNGQRLTRTNATDGDVNSPSDTAIPLNQRPYHVFNVDERGTSIHEGTMEVTSSDLVYRHKGDPLSIYWPLCSLRKYGYNADLFSFVCGRRCPTGPGIYAFKCSQALQLFEELDEALKGISSANSTATNTPPSVPMARNSANQWQQYRPISSLALVSCRNPIPTLTATNTSPSALAGGASAHISNPHNLNTNDNPSSNSEMDNVKSPAYYVNVPTCDPNNVSPTGVRGNHSAIAIAAAASQYVNTDPEVFASVQLAAAASSSSSASASAGCNNATSASPVKVKSPNDSHNPGHNGQNSVNKPHSIYSLKSSPASATSDANSNITSKKTPNEHLSYITLDLDSNTNGVTVNNSVYVTSEPVTPVNRSPKEEMTWTPPEPGTPLSLASVNNSNTNTITNTNTFQLPYAQIDFEKTDALNTAASNTEELK